LAADVIPKSGGADLWKHRVFNREVGAGARSEKREKKTFFLNKEKLWDAKRGQRATGLRDPEKCGDKEDKARRCTLEWDEQGLIAEGGKGEEQSRRFAMELSRRKSPPAR